MGKKLRWHIVQTEPRRETMAAAGLVGRWFNTYVPALRTIVRGRDDTKQVQWRPLFPGYIFVADGHHHVERMQDIPGVTSVMKIEDRWALLDDAVIRAIRRQVDEENDASALGRPRLAVQYSVGQIVRIVDGAFGGFTGPITMLDENDRITLLVDGLGRLTPLSVKASEIEAA